MSDLVRGFDAGKALIEAGLASKQCTEVVIRFTANGVVELTTKSHMTPEEWDKVEKIVKKANESGELAQRHDYVNAADQAALSLLKAYR